MINNKIKINISITIFLTIILPIIAGSFLNSNFPIEFISIPLHSALEVAGGVIAIVISIIFYIKYSKTYLLTHFTYTTIALLSMGIVDIFHGIVMPGKLFVWLHSSAVFFGGIFFMTVWLKQQNVSKKIYKAIPIFTIIFALIFSIVSISFPNIVPTMLNEDKTFSSFANLLNIIGGIGFFIASVKFLKEYINDNNIENLLFSALTMLFGVAGILFVSSVVWDMQWWLWHFLRLTAYSIALYFLYKEFNKEITLINDSNDELEKANNKMTKYLNIIDQNVITSSTDIKGNITDVSEAFCNISGYEKDELIGKNHRIVKHIDMQKSLYDDMWHTLNKNDPWYGEIKNKKKDGTHYWVCATISPIFNNENKKIGYTAVRQDITDKKHIEHISITDALTDIFNRRHFNDIFPKVINSSKIKNELVCFLIMDVDHFKQYNDTYGHQMGDDVLKAIGKTLKSSLQKSDDYCFRLGGEEFGVVFKAEDKMHALQFSTILKNSLEDLKIEHKGNSASSYVTASMGLVCKNANDIKDDDEVYKDADNLLYEAKESGRNKVCVNG